MFLYRSNNNVIEYCCSGILHDWDMSFEKLGGQPTFWGLTAKDRDKFVFKSMSANEFNEVPHIIGSKIPLDTVCYRQLQSDGAHCNWRAIHHSNFLYYGGVGDFYWYPFDEKTGSQHCINTLRPRQNGRRFADDTFKRIFLNENARISIKISLKFVP